MPAATSSLCFTGVRELAQLIRTKQLSARELIAEHLKQIEAVNPKVNAIVTLTAEAALKAAAEADEWQARGEALPPLHGLPVVHKDLFETRGVRTTYGSPLYQDFVPNHDHTIVERLRQAGAITLGKTNTPELAIRAERRRRSVVLTCRYVGRGDYAHIDLDAGAAAQA